MLIQSHRHTPSDLALWEEYLDLDRHGPFRKGFLEKLETVKKDIMRFAESGKRYFLCTSWGKDSLVVTHLFHSLGLKPPVIYVRQLDNENPESQRVKEHYLSRYEVPGYREIAYTYRDAQPSWFKEGKPNRWYQILHELETEYGCHVTGIRADESSKRRKRCCVFGLETISTYAPISWLTNQDVFAYLELMHLPVHPSYAMLGGGRWPRERIRVTAIGNQEGAGIGRREWEMEYYGDVVRRMQSS